MSGTDNVLNHLTAQLRSNHSARANEVLKALHEHVAGYPITPMVRFDTTVAGKPRRIHLKLEGQSPWQSIKGRTAIGLVASIVEHLGNSSQLLESTSGNLGVALAGLACDLRLPFVAVVDDRLPAAMGRRMRDAGATLEAADTGSGTADRLESRIRTAARLVATLPGAVWPNQYGNPMNPFIHELWTGPELLAQTPDARAVFVAASTGGTLAGVSRAVRASGAECAVIGVDVEGSRALGGSAGPRVLTGIGSSRISAYLDKTTCDHIEWVSSQVGAELCRRWKQVTGLALGGSSGAVLAGALQYLVAHPELTSVACLCPDLGENYADTIYDTKWADQNLTESFASVDVTRLQRHDDDTSRYLKDRS